MDDFDRGFISGFLDADGSIIIRKLKSGSATVAVQFYNNNIDTLVYLQEKIGKEYCSLYVTDKGDRMSFSLNVKKAMLLDLLKQLNLVMKEKRRVLAIKLLEMQLTPLKMRTQANRARIEMLIEEWEKEIHKKLSTV